MAGKVALLLWAQTLGLAGAQTTQLLVEPPWRLVVLWDWVTLSCQGLGTASATTWYKDSQHWWRQGRHHLSVTERGDYTSDRPSTGRSPPVTVFDDQLVLQVPAQALLDRDTVTLRCRCRQDNHLTRVRFYWEDKDLGMFLKGTKLSLSPLQLPHSGGYQCEGLVHSEEGTVQKSSAQLHITVHRVPPSGVALLVQTPGGQVALGDHLVLSCVVATGTGPLSFSWHREGSAALLGTGPCLELRYAGDNDSSQYRCRVSDGDSEVEIDPLNATVLVPVANATIIPGPLSHQVRAGDNVTLSCSVRVGPAPVTFTWLHTGQEVAQGPLLELRAVNVGHSGIYQCVATNQLGQDGHRLFRALSPELALEVTPGSPWVTVATVVGGALLFLLLLLGVIVTWHWWHCVDARKNQERAPPDPPAPPEEGEVLYTYIAVTKRAGTPLVLQVPAWALLERDTVTLCCRRSQDNPVNSVSFYCTSSLPVANATISLSPLSYQVHAGDPVTLHCSVQVGSAPVTFTWLHNGQEVAQGPLPELRAVDVGDSGPYQCMVTNQLDGQLFRHSACSRHSAESWPWR
ncbi:Fc receptor-like protein 4 [Melospiza georgiana]|uniref:Fc receptor-like protein 4 n=1 Tax=Melospiza georgiana TaxID=44398 RepID=UPI0025AC277A|nr:Fc receptor-like protein 4 [Melospiza georgiana]